MVERDGSLSKGGVGEGLLGVWCWGRAGPSVAHFLHATEDPLEVRAQYPVIVKLLWTDDAE